MADHVITESRCPYCDHRFDRSANVAEGEDQAPCPGDISICISCASLLEFDSGLLSVRLTPEREKTLAADPGVQSARAAVLALDRREMRNDR